jgi:hypothetical protein
MYRSFPVSKISPRIVAMKRLRLAGLVGFFLLLLAGCSSQPSKPAEEPSKPQAAPAPKQVEEVNGRVAFQRLYVAARGWAPDARPYRLQSQPVKQSTGKDGKSAVWRAFFASQSRRSVKPYVWSGVQADDAPSPGISPGAEDTYNPSNTNTQIFDIGFLKIDSDKACEVAQKHGGDKLMKKDPSQPVLYTLDWSPRANELIWHVMFGSQQENAKLRVAVNATSGEFLRLEK